MIATASVLKLIALIIPLGLDTLGVSLALGLAGLPLGARRRLALTFAAFETAMPLLGAAAGAPLGRTIGDGAGWLAALLLVVLALYMLGPREQRLEGGRLLSLTRGGLAGVAALGIGISLDELAIGFSAGLLRLPIVALAIAVGAQAFVFTRVGLALGSRAGAAVGELAERVAAAALLALAAVLVLERVGA